MWHRRATHDPHYTWHGDRGSPSHFCTPNFFDPVSSFAARGFWNVEGKMPPARENDYNSILNRSGLKKCGPTASKISKNRNFCSKFTHNGKCWGSTEKVEYRCTTTNLPLCNDVITILKITLLHSVSVITNFIIPKRDKKTSHYSRLQPARDPRSPPYSAWW